MGPPNALVGPNGVGKSLPVAALSLLQAAPSELGGPLRDPALRCTARLRPQ